MWKDIANDYTAKISFKLINFCMILLNQIFRKPTVYNQWVKAQLFPVTFTLSIKNMVI